MKQLLVAAACAIVMLVSCAGGESDLAVVNKVLKKDTNASMAGGPDMGVSVPSSGSIFWVEGSLKNNGKEEAKDVTVAFRVNDGNTTFVLSAVIPSIQPGKTVAFRTPPHGSRLELRLIEEEPEISVGK